VIPTVIIPTVIFYQRTSQFYLLLFGSNQSRRYTCSLLLAKFIRLKPVEKKTGQIHPFEKTVPFLAVLPVVWPNTGTPRISAIQEIRNAFSSAGRISLSATVLYAALQYRELRSLSSVPPKLFFFAEAASCIFFLRRYFGRFAII
jgi:hypothetical protein